MCLFSTHSNFPKLCLATFESHSYKEKDAIIVALNDLLATSKIRNLKQQSLRIWFTFQLEMAFQLVCCTLSDSHLCPAFAHTIFYNFRLLT